MSLEFDPRHMMVSRGKVYNKSTGRYLGEQHEFEESAEEAVAAIDISDLDSASVPDLKAKAKELGIAGFSNMSKPNLIEAISGVVDQSEEEPDGADQADSESGEAADST